jgi:polysaccharide export outer membrane protein
MRINAISLLALFVAISMASCVSSKKLTEQSVYFKNISDSLLQRSALEYEPRFQKGDILSITVITPNVSSARLFNMPNVGVQPSGDGDAASGTGASGGSGYLVDERGNIIFPYLGYVKAAGLSRLELTDTLSSRLRKYIDSALVVIRLLNYRVTVLGEVARPGTFSIPSERVSVLDAIGLAGDLTVYGKRSNIRIIRTTGGVKQTATLDLNKGDIFGSPFFYLRQNDIVYVEMNDRKIPNTDQASLRNLSFALGIISALGVVISTINVLK